MKVSCNARQLALELQQLLIDEHDELELSMSNAMIEYEGLELKIVRLTVNKFTNIDVDLRDGEARFLVYTPGAMAPRMCTDMSNVLGEIAVRLKPDGLLWMSLTKPNAESIEGI